MKRAALVLATFLWATEAVHATVINGDFETGDLTGWTLFTTTNGTLGGPGFPSVVPFDTNNDTIPSLAAQFRVGQVTFTAGVPAGGGIYQSIVLGAGPFQLSADIAALAGTTGNAAGGFFELMFDGAVVDSHDFGLITGSTAEHSMLASLASVAAGAHEVRLRITRPFLQGCGGPGGSCTPMQYVDNVKVVPGSVPEPVTLTFLALGLIGLAAVRSRR